MSRPTWLVTLIKRTFPGRFAIAHATKAPLLGPLLDRWLFHGDDLFYLPPDRVLANQSRRTVAVGQEVTAPQDAVLPSQIVEHFIEAAGFHWIMNSCICRDASSCTSYPIDIGCLFLGEAAAGINPALGRRVSKEQALAHVRRAREAGLVHLIGRNKLDTVWLGVGPGDRLLTICNCCPCCCLWRVLPHVSDRIGERVTRLEGVRVVVTDRCVGCGACTLGVCFVDAIHLDGDRAQINDDCRGCGRCVDVCPQQAIELTVADSRFVEQAIARLSPLVDVT